MRSSQLGSRSTRRREQEKATGKTEKTSREKDRKSIGEKERDSETLWLCGCKVKSRRAGKKRERESDNKWNDAPCEGLPRVHSAT